MKRRIFCSTVFSVLTVCCQIMVQAQDPTRKGGDAKPLGGYTLLRPDLVVKDITLNEGWAKGKGPRGIRVLVANVGEGPSVACQLAVTIKALKYVVELNTVKQKEAGDFRLMDMPPLKAGQEEWVEQTYGLLGAQDEAPPTIQSVTAEADAVPTKVKESNETNNELTLKGDAIKPFSSSSGGRGRSMPSVDLTKLVNHLPDLVVRRVEFGYSNENPHLLEKTTITVLIRNRGEKGFDSSYVKGPIQVWLRVWKPADEQSFTEVEPKATTFVWGAVMEVSDLGVGEDKSVTFTVPKPPGGWEASRQRDQPSQHMTTWVYPEYLKRLRIVARVDPSNRIKESDESNNNGFIFEPGLY